MLTSRNNLSGRNLSLALCIFLSSSPAVASNKDLAWEIMKASGQLEAMDIAAKEGFKAGIAPVAQQLKGSMGDSADPIINRLETEVGKLLADFLADKSLLDSLAQIYADQFSTAELTEILAFYNSAVGIKIKALAPEMAAAGAEAGQKVMIKAMPTFQAKIQETMIEAGAEAQQCISSRG